MARSLASRSGTARVALVGATSAYGARLRAGLAALGVPGERVDLYARTTGEAVLSDYGGEARLIQEPQPDEIAAHDVIFVCEGGGLADEVVGRARRGAVVIDLVGAVPRSRRARLVHMDLNPPDEKEPGACLAIPHPLAIILGELLHSLEQELGLEEVVAVILRPAADFGAAGLEELRDQTVRLLSFAPVPVETFGRQLAFNVIPQRTLRAAPGLEATIGAHVAELLGWSRPRLTLRLLAAPVFHGHGIQLRVRLRRAADSDRVRDIVEGGRFYDPPHDDAPATPVEVSEDYRISLAELCEDGLGGYWIWAVAGEADAKGAEQAIRLADAVCDL